MENIGQIAAPLPQQIHRAGLCKHRKGRQLILTGIFLPQGVIHMVQRPHAEARDVGDHQIAPLFLKKPVQIFHQFFRLIADTVPGDLRRVALPKRGQLVIRQPFIPQVIGDHGRLRPLFRQRHHCRRLSGTQKTAEYCEFPHVLPPNTLS